MAVPRSPFSHNYWDGNTGFMFMILIWTLLKEQIEAATRLAGVAR